MSVIFDTKMAGAQANSYVTLEEANAYFANHKKEADWTALTDDLKKKALIQATADIDSHRFPGYRYRSNQSLDYPRIKRRDKVAQYHTGRNSLQLRQEVFIVSPTNVLSGPQAITPFFQTNFEAGDAVANIGAGTKTPLDVGPDVAIINADAGDYSTKAYSTTAGAGNSASDTRIQYKMDDGNFPSGIFLAKSFTMFIKFSNAGLAEDGFFLNLNCASGKAIAIDLWGASGPEQGQNFYNVGHTVGTWTVTDHNTTPGQFGTDVGYAGTTIVVTFDHTTGTFTTSYKGPNGTATLTNTLTALTHSEVLSDIELYQVGNQDPTTPVFEDFRIYDEVVNDPFQVITATTDYHTDAGPSGDVLTFSELIDTNELPYYDDDFFKDGEIQVISGTGKGEILRIAESSPVTGELTLTGAFSTAPDTSSRILVYGPIPREIRNATFEQAIYRSDDGSDEAGSRASLIAQGVKSIKVGHTSETYRGGGSGTLLTAEAWSYISGLISRTGRIT